MANLAAMRSSLATIPASAGIGLRAEHYREVVETRPAIEWFEVHSENYFGAGGLPLHYLERVRAEHPVSLHGVGLELQTRFADAVLNPGRTGFERHIRLARATQR